jgi:hypothetical protein
MLSFFSSRKAINRWIAFLVFLLPGLFVNAQQKIDIGVFPSSQQDQFEIKLKSNYDVNFYLTNLQFTVKWPIQSNFNLNYPGAISPYSVLAQGQYQSGGYNYWVFVSPGGSLLNMTSGVEYVCAAFSFTQTSCMSFEIAADNWTFQNNGDFYIEINGLPKTGLIYQPILNITNFAGAAGGISGPSQTCQNSQFTYAVNPIANAESYIWNYSGSGVTINGNGNNVSLTFSNQATSGYLTVAGLNSCGQGQSSQPYFISIDQIPIINQTITGPTNLCAGQQNIIYEIPQSGNGLVYNWIIPSGFTSTGSTGSNSIILNLQQGAADAELSVFLSNNCGNSDTISLPIKIHALPLAQAGNDTVINYGTFAYLVAGNPGIPNCGFQWEPQNKVVSAHNQSTVSMPLANSNTFSLYVTDTIWGCQSHDFKQVILTGGPLSISPEASSDTVCMNDSIQLFANPCCGTGNYSYQWYSPDFTNPIWQSNNANPKFQPLANTTVYLIVSDGFDQDTAYLNLWINQLPTAFYAIVDTICENDSSGIILNFTGTPPFSFLFTNSTSSQIFNNIYVSQFTIYVNQGGIYEVINFQDSLCSGTVNGNASIVVNPVPPSPSISLAANILSSNYAFGNQWYSMSGPVSGAVNQQFAPQGPGVYYCIVTIGGCISAPSNSVTITSTDRIPTTPEGTNLFLFPNPSFDRVFLKSGDNSPITAKTIKIFSVSGILTMEMNIPEGDLLNKGIDISKLASGMYFLQITEEEKTTLTLKFVKE